MYYAVTDKNVRIKTKRIPNILWMRIKMNKKKKKTYKKHTHTLFNGINLFLSSVFCFMALESKSLYGQRLCCFITSGLNKSPFITNNAPFILPMRMVRRSNSFRMQLLQNGPLRHLRKRKESCWFSAEKESAYTATWIMACKRKVQKNVTQYFHMNEFINKCKFFCNNCPTSENINLLAFCEIILK